MVRAAIRSGSVAGAQPVIGLESGLSPLAMVLTRLDHKVTYHSVNSMGQSALVASSVWLKERNLQQSQQLRLVSPLQYSISTSIEEKCQERGLRGKGVSDSLRKRGPYGLITSWGTTNNTSRVDISILLILIVQFSSCMRWVIHDGAIWRKLEVVRGLVL